MAEETYYFGIHMLQDDHKGRPYALKSNTMRTIHQDNSAAMQERLPGNIERMTRGLAVGEEHQRRLLRRRAAENLRLVVVL